MSLLQKAGGVLAALLVLGLAYVQLRPTLKSEFSSFNKECIKNDDQLLSFRGSVSEYKLLGVDPTLFSLTFETVNLTGGNITFMTGTYQTRVKVKVKSKRTVELKEQEVGEDYAMVRLDVTGAPYIDFVFPSKKVISRRYYGGSRLHFNIDDWKSYEEKRHEPYSTPIPQDIANNYGRWLYIERKDFFIYFENKYWKKAETGHNLDLTLLYNGHKDRIFWGRDPKAKSNAEVPNRIPNEALGNRGGGYADDDGSIFRRNNPLWGSNEPTVKQVKEIDEDVYKDEKPTKFEIEVADLTLKRYRLSQESTETTFTGTWILPDQNPKKAKLMQHIINFANEIKQECEKP